MLHQKPPGEARVAASDHDHNHDHDHDYGSCWRGAIRELIRPHRHDVADSSDTALEAPEKGIYREADDGTRQWNPDYAEDGFCYDPIYDGISVDLG